MAKQLNHVTLFVRDVAESQRFYQRLFGMPVLTVQPPGVNLATGTGFLGLYPADSGVVPGLIICVLASTASMQTSSSKSSQPMAWKPLSDCAEIRRNCTSTIRMEFESRRRTLDIAAASDLWGHVIHSEAQGTHRNPRIAGAMVHSPLWLDAGQQRWPVYDLAAWRGVADVIAECGWCANLAP